MSLSEFTLIDRYFRRPTRRTILGIGDDAALIQPTAGCELVISTDMLVAGTHFLPDTTPEDLGWKTLAVNVSDMAAMGALPRWAVLAVALPSADESWIEKFTQGFFACAEYFDIDLIGGDTTKGPLNFCVTIFGEVPVGSALLRSGARPGDDIWVSGHPGRAALGLAHLQNRIILDEPSLTECLAALHRPQPRVALGLALRHRATAAIDVSDGLLADLGHILKASGVAAHLFMPTLPPPGIERDCILSGGDDYELLFTAPVGTVLEGCPVTRIGTIAPGAGITLQDACGHPVAITTTGFDHFSP